MTGVATSRLSADGACQETSALPQWKFITLNMVDNSYDTTDTSDKTTDFLRLGLFLALPLNDTNFNFNRALILLTFDET